MIVNGIGNFYDNARNYQRNIVAEWFYMSYNENMSALKMIFYKMDDIMIQEE